MSTLDEVLATRHCLSEYHVYHEPQQNICITPFLEKKKEFGYNKRNQNHREEAEDYEQSYRRSDESNSYFLHQPKLLFHNPPRVFRRGSHKDGEPICLIYSAPSWSHWNVQFQENLGDLIDPRGMIPFEKRSRRDNTTKGDCCAFKGYKVRSWRVWGESGKAHHQRVNARRKMKQEEGQIELPIFDPKFADEGIKLTWSSPFTKPRVYGFEYAGIRFSWKGTRNLPLDDKLAKILLPLNHLKLVAEVPGGKQYVLALFTSSMNHQKYGRLWIFDNVISNLLEEFCDSNPLDQAQATEEGRVPESASDVRTTRLYELIMATSMCMVIGEWEKRMTMYLILILLVFAGRASVA